MATINGQQRSSYYDENGNYIRGTNMQYATETGWYQHFSRHPLPPSERRHAPEQDQGKKEKGQGQ